MWDTSRESKNLNDHYSVSVVGGELPMSEEFAAKQFVADPALWSLDDCVSFHTPVTISDSSEVFDALQVQSATSMDVCERP